MAKASTLTPDRSMDLTRPSFASRPRNTLFAGSAPSAAAIDFTSLAVVGSLGNEARSALSTFWLRGAARSRTGRPRVLSPRLVRAATCCAWRFSVAASAACSTLNQGSPKPAKAWRPGAAAGRLRRVLSDAAEGSMVTAWLRASHGISR